MRDQAWWQLPGLQGQSTALSDHLHEVFFSLSSDYIFVDSEFTRLFEEFELLGSLAYLTVTVDLTALQQAAQGGFGGRNYVRAPFGRVSWDSLN